MNKERRTMNKYKSLLHESVDNTELTKTQKKQNYSKKKAYIDYINKELGTNYIEQHLNNWLKNEEHGKGWVKTPSTVNKVNVKNHLRKIIKLPPSKFKKLMGYLKL